MLLFALTFTYQLPNPALSLTWAYFSFPFSWANNTVSTTTATTSDKNKKSDTNALTRLTKKPRAPEFWTALYFVWSMAMFGSNAYVTVCRKLKYVNCSSRMLTHPLPARPIRDLSMWRDYICTLKTALAFVGYRYVFSLEEIDETCNWSLKNAEHDMITNISHRKVSIEWNRTKDF